MSGVMDQRGDFLRQIDWGHGLKLVLDQVKDLTFWIKDSKGRFMAVNQNALKKHGLTKEEEMVGKSDWDLSQPHLAEDYVRDDKNVLETGEPVIGRVEMVPQPGRPTAWYNTSKYPLRNEAGEIIGTAGFSLDIKSNGANMNPLMYMVPVIDYIKDHLDKKIDHEFLASICDVPLETFQTRFKKLFSIPCEVYIEKARALRAESLFQSNGKTLQQICTECGVESEEDLDRLLQKHRNRSMKDFLSGNGN